MVNYILITIICNAIVFACEIYFDIRQMQLLSKQSQATLPPKLRAHIDKDEFEDMQTYSILRLSFARLESTYGFIAECGTLMASVFLWAQNVSSTIVSLVFDWSPQEAPIIHGVFFLFMVSLCSAIMKAPFEIYRITVIDSKFMRSGNTGSAMASWMVDQLKMFVLAVCVGIPLLSLILKLISIADTVHWLYLWIGSVACGVFLGELYPTLLAQIFNTVQNLEGPMTQKIMNLAERVGVNIAGVSYIDGSVRGSGANAVLAGLGKRKRIVLYDNLLEQLDEDEVLSILAHELGHYKWNHSAIVVLVQALSMGCFLFALSQSIYNPDFYRSFGFTEINHSVGLLLFSYLYQPFSNIMSVISNVVQRSQEYTCDRFALDLGYDIEQPLIKMHINNIYNIVMDKHYSRYYNSHPSLMERLEKIEDYKRKLELKQRLQSGNLTQSQMSARSEQSFGSNSSTASSSAATPSTPRSTGAVKSAPERIALGTQYQLTSTPPEVDAASHGIIECDEEEEALFAGQADQDSSLRQRLPQNDLLLHLSSEDYYRQLLSIAAEQLSSNEE